MSLLLQQVNDGQPAAYLPLHVVTGTYVTRVYSLLGESSSSLRFLDSRTRILYGTFLQQQQQPPWFTEVGETCTAKWKFSSACTHSFRSLNVIFADTVVTNTSLKRMQPSNLTVSTAFSVCLISKTPVFMSLTTITSVLTGTPVCSSSYFSRSLLQKLRGEFLWSPTELHVTKTDIINYI